MYKQLYWILCILSLSFWLYSCSPDEPQNPNDDEIIDTPSEPEDPTDPTIGITSNHEWHDLGLSVKWSTCNIGASKITDYGDYFCWSGTSPKKYFYSWECDADGVDRDLLKSRGIVDKNYNLTAKYDAATVIWGESWRMPTYDEICELKEKCSWTVTEIDGVVGYLATGPNKESLFFPAAGHIVLSEHRDIGDGGSYWSATASKGGSLSYRLGFEISDLWVYWGYSGRECGLPIRPVTNK